MIVFGVVIYIIYITAIKDSDESFEAKVPIQPNAVTNSDLNDTTRAINNMSSIEIMRYIKDVGHQPQLPYLSEQDWGSLVPSGSPDMAEIEKVEKTLETIGDYQNVPSSNKSSIHKSAPAVLQKRQAALNKLESLMPSLYDPTGLTPAEQRAMYGPFGDLENKVISK